MKQQKQTPVGSVIKVGERPDTTLSLIPAIRNAAKTVSTYVFTNSIRGHFSTILENVAMGKGQGFWVNAEMGAGKTHFLAVLTLLLSNSDKNIWQNVQDDAIKNYSKRLSSTKLFPVVLSLRGEGGDEHTEKTLLEVIEEAIINALEEYGLKDQILVTSAEEIISWFDGLPVKYKNPIVEDIQEKTKLSPAQYQKESGRDSLAKLIWKICHEHGFKIDIATSTKDRIAAIYDQLTAKSNNSYNGLLFVIDEFAFWQDMHPEGSPQHARDEEVLETLAFVLPKDMHYNIYTIVASQKHVPTKLWGSGSGDRFINLVLMRDGSEREYDIIVSRRVREIIKERIPEINQYYEYYVHNFDFMKDIDEELFQNIFPFQPRCFDVLRQITARNLPTARIGINVLHEVIDPNSAHNKDDRTSVLARDQLITVADLMLSRDLTAGLSTAPAYSTAYEAFETAIRNLDKVDVDKDQKDLAQRIIKTLFLWHCTSPDSPMPFTVHELAQATLTTDGIVKSDDEIALILSKLQDLAQISFIRDKQEATFNVRQSGLTALEVFNELKQKITGQFEISRLWRESLNKPGSELGGLRSIFAEMTAGFASKSSQEIGKIEYTGELLVGEKWQTQWGESNFKEDYHFRIVTLMESTDIFDGDIKDDRIVVCIPGELSSEAADVVRAFGAIQRMEQLYKDKKEKDAEQIREWIKARKPDIARELINTQYAVYRAGKILTKNKLSLDAGDVFSVSDDRRRVSSLVTPLLAHAYSDVPKSFQAFKKTYTSADAFKLIAGFFNSNPKTADKSAAENFGVGLELSKPENPRKFAPVPPFAFDYVRQILTENDGHVSTWKIYQNLSNPPYGLTYPLITVYLLSFVRYASPPVDLYLKSGHSIVLRTTNQRPKDNRINSSIIPEVDWKSGVEKYFDTLSRSSGPSWNDIVPFARIFFSEFKATTDLTEIERQETKLMDIIRTINKEIGQVDGNVKLLASSLDEELNETDNEVLQKLAGTVECQDCGSFFSNAQGKYNEPALLENDYSIYKNWKTVSDYTAEIIHVRKWLDQVVLPASESELDLSLKAITNQLALSSLVKTPSLWLSIKANFDKFRTSYRNRYQAYHRDYYKEQADWIKKKETILTKLEALQKLNKIEELGKPVGANLPDRFKDIDQNMISCSVTNVTNVSVENQPCCPQCNLKFNTLLPKDEINELDKEVDRALREQSRRLASETIKQVLSKSENDQITKFLQIIQGSNLAPLIAILDDDLINFIRSVLKQKGVKAESSPVLKRLRDKFPIVEEDKLEGVVEEFRTLLHNAFSEIKKRNPGKKVTISLE